MIDLQDGLRPFRLDGFGNFGKAGNFFITVDTNGAREGQAIVIDKAALDDDGPDAARTGAVVLHQLAGDRAVIIAGTGGHRRHKQAVF